MDLKAGGYEARRPFEWRSHPFGSCEVFSIRKGER